MDCIYWFYVFLFTRELFLRHQQNFLHFNKLNVNYNITGFIVHSKYIHSNSNSNNSSSIYIVSICLLSVGNQIFGFFFYSKINNIIAL